MAKMKNTVKLDEPINEMDDFVTNTHDELVPLTFEQEKNMSHQAVKAYYEKGNKK